MRKPTFKEAFLFWLKLGFISFGGPSGQIAIMHEELVERRKWISESRFLHALNFCMLLPGPEATQLAIYIGWLLHRTWGGIVAGSLFVLPSAFILWGLSLIYVKFGSVPWIESIFYGLKPAVLAIVAAAVLRIGRKALKNPIMWGIAAGAFASIFFGRVPFPLIVFGAAVVGFTCARSSFIPKVDAENIETVLSNEHFNHSRDISITRSVKVIAVSLLLWWLPVAAIGLVFGRSHTLFQEGVFFSKAAMVTFGGAYAVLPYVSQKAVEDFGWLSAAQMLDGLGLAETTPGPLIMVLQFVGFAGGWKFHAPLTPLVAATLGAFITTWATFVPCFLWILLGAPHIERLRQNRRFSAALSVVTAAVVGVILNLAVWFGGHVIFPPGQGSDWFVAAIATIAFIGLTKWKWNIVPVVLGAGLIGIIWKALGASV